MSKVKENFISSAKELKTTRNMVLCAMMAALSIVLSYTTSISITPHINIGFSGIPNRIVDFLFGPITGCIFGGMMDILKFFLKPNGAFFFGYTLSAMLASFIYGVLLYKRQVKSWKFLLNLFLAEILVKILINCCLNTLWSSMLSGKAFMVLLPARLIKNILQIFVDTLIHYFVFLLFQKLRRYLLPNN